MDTKLNKIEEAIEDIKAGKVIIVVDDEDRENEGDFVAAARTVTPEMINFMDLNSVVHRVQFVDLYNHLSLKLFVILIELGHNSLGFEH